MSARRFKDEPITHAEIGFASGLAYVKGWDFYDALKRAGKEPIGGGPSDYGSRAERLFFYWWAQALRGEGWGQIIRCQTRTPIGGLKREQ